MRRRLPVRDDRAVLYHNPRTCGYFIAVALDPAMDAIRARSWLAAVGGLVDDLVARLAPVHGEAKGEKVAAVAVGLAPTFFVANGQSRFGVRQPAAFRPGAPLPTASPALGVVAQIDADVLFYVASVFEARVNAFIAQLAQMRPDVQRVTFDRGYQRLDGAEPFGYRDGVRNVRTTDRPRFVFVHRDGEQPDEPEWADGGSYMAYMKIIQHPDAFATLPDDATRDAVVGRTKDGTRLDLTGQQLGDRAPRGRHDPRR